MMRGMAEERSSEERVCLLQGMPIFGALDGAALRLVLERAQVVTVPAGRAFFEEGERGVATYALEAGRVAVLRHWRGENRRIRELGPGDCFGEVALFDFGPRSASVVALEDCRALEITPAVLRALRESDLEQFTLITMNLGRELSRRLRRNDEWLFRVRMELTDAEPDSPTF
jgi:CRP-like cAMP-binding protein